MLNTAIEQVEYKPGSQTVLLVLKDFRQVLLEFPSPEEALDLADALRALSRPSESSPIIYFWSFTLPSLLSPALPALFLHLPALHTSSSSSTCLGSVFCWTTDGALALQQSAVENHSHQQRLQGLCSVQLKVFTSTFCCQACSSYPEEAIVPASITDEGLTRVVKFRQNGRFPVVAYHHQ